MFAIAYLEIARTIQDWLLRRRFDNAAMVTRYAVAFASFYRRALEDYERGARERVPDCWTLSFDASRTGECTVAQDLILGINAHINHDLPFAVLHAGIDPGCPACFRDHARINNALRAATRRVRRKIASVFQPPLRLRDIFRGRLIDRVTAAAFRQSRQDAWMAAQALSSADTPLERHALEQGIRDRAASASRCILREGCDAIECINALRDGGSRRHTVTLDPHRNR